MNCKRYAKWINEAALGGLGAGREAELHRHLLGCPRCQTQLEQQLRLLAAIDQTMARSLAAEAGDELHLRVRQKIAESAAAKAGFWRPLRSLAAVAAACAVIVAIVLGWQMQRPSAPRLTAPSATVAREQPVRREIKTVASSGNRAHQDAARYSTRRARLRRPGNNPSHQGTMPQVLVPKNEMALVLELYNGVRTGKIDGASLLATPPGFRREADGTLVAVPIEIKPIEIAKLDLGLDAVRDGHSSEN